MMRPAHVADETDADAGSVAHVADAASIGELMAVAPLRVGKRCNDARRDGRGCLAPFYASSAGLGPSLFVDFYFSALLRQKNRRFPVSEIFFLDI